MCSVAIANVMWAALSVDMCSVGQTIAVHIAQIVVPSARPHEHLPLQPLVQRWALGVQFEFSVVVRRRISIPGVSVRVVGRIYQSWKIIMVHNGKQLCSVIDSILT